MHRQNVPPRFLSGHFLGPCCEIVSIPRLRGAFLPSFVDEWLTNRRRFSCVFVSVRAKRTNCDAKKYAAHLTPPSFTEYLSRFWPRDVQNPSASLVKRPLGV